MTWKSDKLDELFADEKAVSPVVGVALLIAMTVILAAVIATVVLGLGAGAAEAPQASFSFETDDSDNVIATHDGGDALDGDELVIRNGAGNNVTGTLPDEWTAGHSENLGAYNEIRIIWEDPNSDQTAVIAEYEA